MTIAGGDWRFFYPENITNFAGIPSAWDTSLNTGIGQPQLNTLWITGYLHLTAFFSKIGFSWNLISLLFWIIPPIVIGVLSMFFLYKFLWNENNKFAFVASLIYISNTYFLMIFSGGQLGVAIAYSFVPLVVLGFLKNIKNPNLYNSIFFGIAVSLQILFDPRIFFVTCILMFASIFIGKPKVFFASYKFTILLPALIVFLVHGYWVIPIIIYYLGVKAAPSIYSRSNDLTFFSFAKLENSISLLHPNWPENIFGRVHFMRPEFLIIPILGFIPMLNKKSKNFKAVLIFLLVILLCAFLAKGSNDPFGIVYVFLLKYIPGFSVFRDPTKFYIPIAFCYSLLIPLAFIQISKYITKFKRIKKYSELIIIALFGIVWISFSFPLLQGKVGGIFRLRTVSNDYINLKNYIVRQPEFYRTLWIPQIQRFGYFSNTHPAIGRGEIFKDQTLKGILKELNSKGMEQKLAKLSVKYVIVPFDSEADIFVDDGKYDKRQYDLAVDSLEKVPYLTKERAFGRIIIFKTKYYDQHFTLSDGFSSGRIKILEASPNKYKLFILLNKPVSLVFGDSYDPNWKMKTPTSVINSANTQGFNSFFIDENKSSYVEIYYEPQKIVTIFYIVSLITTGSSIGYLILFAKAKK